MAVTLPAGGITLHGTAEKEDLKKDTSSAILLKLGDDVLRDVRKAAQEKERLSFVTGATPKLRIGSRLIDLTISSDEFRNELFASTSPTDFTFTSIVSHRAEVKGDKSRGSDDTSGSDAALAALQNSLASLKQEKEAKQVNITNSVIKPPKNRYEAARNERLSNKNARPGFDNLSRSSTPPIGAISSAHLGAGPTSAPTTEEDLRQQAIRTPLIHLLAIKPVTSEEVIKKTHIPKTDLDSILQRVGKQADGKWQLSDKAYKELDVWKFEYPSQEQRQTAIDNAVRAYDRQRIERDSKLWQLLLPREERGKGKILSRLHLGGGGQINRGLTPSYQPSPAPHEDESRAASTFNTPKLGASTPRPGSSKGDVMKRLLSKDPKKARAAEDAKEKKRKEREAAASDRESAKPAKKQATGGTKKANVKSEEFVHSSDEDSDEEPASQQTTEKSKPTPEKAKAAPKPKSKAVVSSSSDSSDAALKDKVPAKPAAKNKAAPTVSDHPINKATKPKKPEKPTNAEKSDEPEKATTGKATPQPNNNLSAPNTQQRSQRSPSNQGNRPNVPSPLGAARPRNASDVSDRGAVGVQKVRQGAETPKGLGISTNGVKKTDGHKPGAGGDKTAKKGDESKASEKQKTGVNGMGTAKSSTDGKTQNGIKRKADDAPSQNGEVTGPKHRKTDSSSSQSQAQSHKSQTSQSSTGRPSNGSNGSNGTENTSPTFENGDSRSSSSDTADSVLDTITFGQGVKLAEKFKSYYPKYAEEYDRQAKAAERGQSVGKEEREKLMEMHRRLERMKMEMKVAATREHLAYGS